MGFYTPLLVAALVVSTQAVPTGQRHSCATSCSNGDKFSYERGTSYEYNYEVETATLASAYNSDDKASTTVYGKATIGVVGPCEYVLTLSDITLGGSQGSDEFASQLSASALRFAFDDGKISNLCKAEDEQDWTLNFKRGVLSSFQNSMEELNKPENIHELDVTGACETTYTIASSSEETTVINKSRPSNQCTRTPEVVHSTLPEALHKLPIISADQYCTQTITEGILVKVECQENLAMKPLTSSQGVATTVINTKLTLRGKKSGVVSTDFALIDASMKFDSVAMKKNSQESFMKIQVLLNELNDKSSPVMGAEVPALFTELIDRMRSLDYDQITMLFETNRGLSVRKFLIDATPMVATSATTKIVADMIKNKEMSVEDADIWYTSLNFVRNPTEDMFAPLSELLRDFSSKSAIMGVSALVNNYCNTNNNCVEEAGISSVLSSLEQKLGSACRSTDIGEKETILTILRAIGTGGRWTKPDIIVNCFEDESNPDEVRVAAINAWRTAPCSYDRKPLQTVYSNVQNDPELRISAYLSLISCPTSETIDSIKERLEVESANQVSTFVWSHLSNLQESASHQKQWIREVIGEETLVNKFNSTGLQFSRNMESSFYMEEIGAGATVESNVIFSSKSFLPRSAMLNFTFDMFGETINLFEMGGRFEGFEIFAEKFFGQNGYYPEETVEAVLRSLRQGKPEETTIEDMLNVVTDEPEGSYYMRVLGNDFRYHHFRGIENFFEKSTEFDLSKFLSDLLKSGKTDYSKSYQIIDTELTYSTVSGLPLKLNVHGSATIGLQIDGSFMFRSFKDFDINGHLYPSAAVEIDALMMIDSHFSKSGVKMSSSGLTSVVLDGHVKIESDKVVDITVNMHEEKRIEILNLKTETVFFGDNIITSVTSTVDEEKDNCMSLVVSGVDICYGLTNSPYRKQASLFALTQGTQDSYRFKYLKDSNSLSVLFDTPNSKVNRKIAFSATKYTDSLTVDIETPWKVAKGTIRSSLETNVQNLEFEALIDNTREYKGGVEVGITHKGNAKIMKVKTFVGTSKGLLVDIGGMIEANAEQGSILVDLKSIGAVDASIKFKGTCIDGLKSMDVDISSPILVLSASGLMDKRNKIHSQLDIEYKIMERNTESLNYLMKIEKNSLGADDKTVLEVTFKSSKLPKFSVSGTGSILLTPGVFKSDASIEIGDKFFDLRSTDIIKYASTEGVKRYNIESEIKSNSHSIDVMFNENFELRSDYFIRDSYLRLAPDYEIKSKSEVRISSDNGLAHVDIELPHFRLQQDITYTKIAPRHWTIQVQGEHQSNSWLMNVMFKDQSVTGENINIEASVDTKFNGETANGRLAIEAADKQLSVEASAESRHLNNYVKFDASPSTFLLDTNVGYSISLRGKSYFEGPTKSVEINGICNGVAIEARIATTPSSIEAGFEYGRLVKSFKAAITDRGATVEMELSPAGKIRGVLDYSFGRDSNIELTISTPFSGYEKQGLSFKLERISNNSFVCGITATLKNTHLINMNISGSIEDYENSMKGEFNFKISCDRSYIGFDNQELKLTYSRSGSEINSSVRGSLDGNVYLTGELTANMISSASRNLNARLNDFELTLSDNKIGNQRTINAEANVKGKKYAVSVLSTKEKSSDVETCTGSIRLVRPYATPITGSWTTVLKNRRNFVVDFEVTRFWSTYGNLKLHSNMSFLSVHNVEFMMSLVSPDTRLSTDAQLTYESEEFKAYLKTSYNGEQYSISSNGIADKENQRYDLKMTIKSQENVLMKVTLNHGLHRGTYVTKSTISAGKLHFDVSHGLEAKDSLNWTHKLEINSMNFVNEMSHNNGEYLHSINWVSGNKKILRAVVRLTPIIGNNNQLNISLDASSYLFRDVKSSLSFEKKNVTYETQVMYTYGSRTSFESSSICKCLPDECSVLFEMKSSFTRQVTLNTVMQMSPVKRLTVSLTTDEDTATLTSSLGSNTFDFSLVSSLFEYPFTMKSDIYKSGAKRILSVVLSHQRKHEVEITLMNSHLEGSVVVKSGIPLKNWERTSLGINFNIEQAPKTVNIVLQNSIDSYSISGRLDKNSLNVEAKLKESLHQLSASWEINQETGKFSLEITSPTIKVNRFEINGSYDILKKLFNLNAVEGTTEVLYINAQMTNESKELRAMFYGKTLKLDSEDKKYIHLSYKNGEKQININVTTDFENLKSPKILISANTSWRHYESLGVSLSYDITHSTKKCTVTMYRNEDKLSWGLETKSEIIGQRMVSFDLRTPFMALTKLTVNLDYNFSRNKRVAEITMNINDELISYTVSILNSENSLNAVVRSSQGRWSTVSLNGTFKSQTDSINGNMSIQIDNAVIDITGSLSKNAKHPRANLVIKSPFKSFRKLEFDISGVVDKSEKMFEIVFAKETEQFVITINSQKNYKQGEISVNITTPLKMYSSIGFKMGYNFLGNVKRAEMVYTVDETTERFSTEVKINNNNVMLSLRTPFQTMKEITILGDLTQVNDKKMFTASVQNGSQNYSLLGELDLQSFNFELNAPLKSSTSMQITGMKTLSGYTLVYKTDTVEKIIKLDYILNDTDCNIVIETPFEGYEKVLISYKYEQGENFILGSMNLQKGDIKFVAYGEMKFTETQGRLTFSTEIPIVDKHFKMDGGYNFAFNAKTIDLSFTYDNIEHNLSLTFEFDHTSGTVKLAIPFINETVGVAYKLNVDTSAKTVEAELNAYTSNKSLSFKASLAYSVNNFLIELTTPFETLKNVRIAAHLLNNETVKEVHATAQYNTHTYSATAKLQPTSPGGMLLLNVIIGKEEYSIQFGFDKQENSCTFNALIKTPVVDFQNMELDVNIDASGDDKIFTILLKNENMMKMISVKGKFIGDLMNFELITPFAGLENFQTYASLNRSRRSAEFSIMNDGSSAGIRASFNSLSIKVTTPYSAARESSFLLEKNDQGELKLHYQRGDNLVDFVATPLGRKRSFKVTLKSALPGWEFLALTGRLDKDDLIAYLSGQRNEAKMTVEGGGKYSRMVSDIKVAVTTPYTGYEKVNANLKFNKRKNEFKLDIQSTSSNFKIIVNTKPDLFIDVHIPNSVEPTVIKGSLSLFQGKLNVKSRFPMIRSFELAYGVEMGQNTFKINTNMERNGLQIFSLDFDKSSRGATLTIHGRRQGHHSELFFKRVGFQSVEFSFKRDKKEFKVEANGSGNLPVKGELDFVINNSFRAVPRTVTGHISLDRSRKQKTVKLEITFPGMKHYIVNLKYTMSLRKPQTGTYDLSIVTPDRRARLWNNIKGSWDLRNHDDVTITFDLGNMSLSLKGKLHLAQSKFVITSSSPHFEPINVEWQYSKTSTSAGRQRDHYLKIGTNSRFVMAKVKGSFNGLKSGDAEVQLQASRFMANPVELKLRWKRDNSGLSGSGSFTCGPKQGQFTLNKLKREASTKSLVLDFTATTNIPNFRNVRISGEYSFHTGALFKLNIQWDTSKISVNFDINDITNKFTQQSVSLSLPSYGDVDVSFGHDFRNKKKKYTIVAKFMGRESHMKAEWTRNKTFTKLRGKASIDSMFIGQASLNVNYDVSDINNAKAKVQYERGVKHFTLIWKRKLTPNALLASVDFVSSNAIVPSAKIVVDIQYSNGVITDILLQRAQRKVHLKFKLDQTGISGTFTTPYRGFEELIGSVVLENSNPQKRTVTVRYQRGNRRINMDAKLDMTSRRQGSLDISLETPFSIIKTLTLNAKFNNGQGEVHYKRNSVEYHFEGQADVRSDGSSFDVTLKPSNGNQPIKIAFAYNAGHLIKGGDSTPQDIAKLDLQMLGKRIAFDLKGFRNAEQVYIEFKSESTFEKLQKFEFKLDSELNTVQREGLFEITLNEFHFKVRNMFEQKPNNGYYWRSEFDSSMTSLPGLVFGIGRENESRTFTVGTGEDREVTVTFTPKGSFSRGFSGKLSLPKRGILDAAFDVNYRFLNRSELDMDVQLQLDPGRVINANILYNSEGLQARLSSPFTGAHSARVRRSASGTGFLNEIAFDDYNVSLREDFESNYRKGFLFEGEVFGKKMSIDSLLQLNGLQSGEGKFLINTSFAGYEKLGFVFTHSMGNKKVNSQAKVYLPSSIAPTMFARLDVDMNEGLKGEVYVDMSGQLYQIHVECLKSIGSEYKGKIRIETPFHAFTDISVDGLFRSENMQQLEGDLTVKHPLGSLKSSIKYDLSSTEILTVVQLELATMYETVFKLNFNLNKHAGHISSEIALESIRLSAPLTMGLLLDSSTDSNFKITLSSSMNGVSRAGSLDFFYSIEPQLENKVNFAYKGLVLLDGFVTFNFKNGLKASAVINGPRGTYAMEAAMEKSRTQTAVSVHAKTPEFEHKMSVSTHNQIISEVARKISLDFFITSTLLMTDVSYNLNVSKDNENVLTKQTMNIWNKTHSIVAGYSCASKNPKIVIELLTPLFDIEEIKLTSELLLKKNIKALVEVHFNGEIHTVEFRFNKTDNRFVNLFKSPLIQGGLIKIDGSVSGIAEKDIDLMANLKFNQQTFATKVNMKFMSENEMFSSVEVKTPYKGYRKMNFVASLQFDADSLKAVLTADKPMEMNLTFDCSMNKDGYKSFIDISTPMEGLEKVTISAEVPLNKTASKLAMKMPNHEYGVQFSIEHEEFSREMSAQLEVNGSTYGGGVEARYKAPYELAYFYQAPEVNKRFHVMMDSSVFNVVSLMA